MVLKKGFLHIEPDFIKISRFRLITGLLIGAFYSITFYSLLYMSRETIRLLSIMPDYDLWVLTDGEVYFYNLFYAFIATIFGQSVCIIYCLDRPRRIWGRQNYRKTTIINDQRVLNWNFINWFAKLAFVFGLMFGMALPYGYYYFGFYPEYNYIFILIIIVLFLQTWTTFRLTFKKKSITWLVISMISISAFSFGLSRINIIDYKALNENILSKNIHHKYDLDLPESNIYTKPEKLSLLENIYFVLEKGDMENKEPVLVVDRQEIPIDNLYNHIRDWMSVRDAVDIKFMTFRLSVHGRIKMRDVYEIQNVLSHSNIRRFSYAVKPAKEEEYIPYLKHLSFPHHLQKWDIATFKIEDVYERISEEYNIIEIKQNVSGTCLIDNKIVEFDSLKTTLKKLIEIYPKSTLIYVLDKDVYFEDYFKVISSYKEAIYELRDMYAISEYSAKFDEIFDYENRNEVIAKYPYRVFEILENSNFK